MEKKDYYQVLGVNKTATNDEIKRAYKKLAKKYHPDANIGKTEQEKKSTEEQFKEVAEAFEILSNQEKRERYDRFGHDMGRSQGFGGNDMDDIREFIRRQEEEFFSGFNRQPQKPPTQQINLHVFLEDLFNGGQKKIKYRRNIICHSCNGEGCEVGGKHKCHACNGSGIVSGRQGIMFFQRTCDVCGGSGELVNQDKICKTCGGKGATQQETDLEVNIEPGTHTNTGITYEGAGNEYIVNGYKVTSDLIVAIRQKQHDKFERNGDDLHCVLEVPIVDALIGEKIKVTGLDNKERIFTIKECTKNGEKIRLAGIGMPILGTKKFGDLYVHIKHKLPNKISTSEKKLLKELKDSENFRK